MASMANTDGTELAGVFPAQAKKSKSYAVGILATSDHMQAARDLAAFVTSPQFIGYIQNEWIRGAMRKSAFGT